jgi:hypothetical protein
LIGISIQLPETPPLSQNPLEWQEKAALVTRIQSISMIHEIRAFTEGGEFSSEDWGWGSDDTPSY